jgi:hypothetical protein
MSTSQRRQRRFQRQQQQQQQQQRIEDGTQESALEYSDTSEEGSHYFSSHHDKSVQRSRALLDSGESSFRKLRATKSKSSRIVKFASSGSIDELNEFGRNDENVQEPFLPPTISNHHPTRDVPSNPSFLRNWMANLANSFRSPAQDHRKQHKKTHQLRTSSGTMEYPHTSSIPSVLPSREHDPPRSTSQSPHNMLPGSSSSSWETSPLLKLPALKAARVYGTDYDRSGVNLHSLKEHPLKESRGEESSEGVSPPKKVLSRSKAATIAAFFLMDYEAGRPPTLSRNLESITVQQLELYRIRFSWAWWLLGLTLATWALFVSHTQNRLMTAWLHTWAILVFLADVRMRDQLIDNENLAGIHSDQPLVRPLVLFLSILGLESWICFWLAPEGVASTLISSLFKPLVLFYISAKARDALKALWRIGRIVTRVLVIEIFLILTFAAVACRLFHGYSSFQNLSTSWLSLFKCKCPRDKN